MEKESLKDALKDTLYSFIKKFGTIIIFIGIGYMIGLLQGLSMSSNLDYFAFGFSHITNNNRYYCDVPKKIIDDE